jgi:hypothetical protein
MGSYDKNSKRTKLGEDSEEWYRAHRIENGLPEDSIKRLDSSHDQATRGDFEIDGEPDREVKSGPWIETGCLDKHRLADETQVTYNVQRAKRDKKKLGEIQVKKLRKYHNDQCEKHGGEDVLKQRVVNNGSDDEWCGAAVKDFGPYRYKIEEDELFLNMEKVSEKI